MSATPAPDPAARDNLPINSATIPPNALADSTPENPPRESEPSDTVSNLRKSQQKFQRMMCSTPIRSDSSHSRRTTEEQKDALEDELGPIPKLSADFLKSMYKDIKSDTVIKRFLTRSKLYSFKTKRWLDIPETIEKEKELYEPFVKIISKILAGPGRRTTKGTTKREVVDTHNLRFDHHDDLENPTRPDISIMAVGPSFQKPPLKEGKERAKIGYCNVASVFDVKRDADNSDREQARQLAGYNRQIYISQPNRKFACSAIMTETQVRAVHFDHSGAYMTEFVDIHKDPYTFVRLVLGLSSHNEEDVGLDTSIQWETNKAGLKSKGTISFVDASSGKPVTYNLNMEEPPLFRYAIRGTGTTCWSAFDEKGGRVTIKDSWRADGRTPERVYLQMAKDLEGVATEVLAYADNLAQTKSYRPEECHFADGFFNRTLARVVIRSLGPPVTDFTSQKQAIAAVGDSIRGHRDLFNIGILHREITPGNIRLVQGSGPGKLSAVLFNLDMAIGNEEDKPHLSPEGRTGDQLFLSISIINQSIKSQARAAQDYLDDLEAFFYVLCRLLFGYSGVGTLVTDNELLTRWQTTSDITAIRDSKKGFMGSRGVSTTFETVPLFWSEGCITLCNKYRRFLKNIVLEKERIQGIKGSKNLGKVANAMSKLYDGIDSHYASVIGFFDEAVAELSKAGGDAPRRGSSTSPAPEPTAAVARYYEPHHLALTPAPSPGHNVSGESPGESSASSSPPPSPSGSISDGGGSSSATIGFLLVYSDRKRGKRSSPDSGYEEDGPVFKRRRGDAIEVSYHTLFDVSESTGVDSTIGGVSSDAEKTSEADGIVSKLDDFHGDGADL